MSTRTDEEGYEESGEGLWSVAAAIMGGKTMIASIGVAAPLFRTSAQQRKTIRKHVAKAAVEISDLIGSPNK
ncbi:hypothetical protein [Martelella mangrovi]|uniref:DNA-binding IclR family transcriptional regulator n=1 Tax=Martelella mangrovi TaxID=1397477 RepID=A0ABV2IA79_9HYPH